MEASKITNKSMGSLTEMLIRMIYKLDEQREEICNVFEKQIHTVFNKYDDKSGEHKR